MTAKEYLSQARFLDNRINSKIQQVSSLNELATKCTATISDMPHSPNSGGSTMADAVCKIIDYGKYRYEQARKEKEAKKKQKTIEIKEIRLSPNIEENDLNTKVANARKFITKGDRVKVTLRFRGREMAHVQSSKQILDVFAEKLQDVATVEKAPKLEGRNMSMFLTEKR